MRKRWTLLPADEAATEQLHQSLKINPLFCRMLVQRGIFTYDQAKTFFRPDLTQLHDPFLMEDMEKAIERLELAISRQEKILLYGDYDVDGTTCVALLYSFLAPHHKHLGYYLPDRDKEGYGVSKQGIDFAAANGFSLLVAMDCGIQATEKVAYAKTLGIDFIICDHHKPEGELPAAVAVLDPLRSDCLYPYKGLSGCGVVFKMAQAFSQKNNLPEAPLYELLDILVLSIAADIVPITGENRTLAYFGLEKLNHTRRLGLQALIEKSRRPVPFTISDIVFGLAPMINAAGRLGDAALAVRLLLSTEPVEAADHARLLHHQNELRKEHDFHILRQAKKKFEAMPSYADRKSILLFDEHWHKGVVGIAAARMVEHFHRPTVLLTLSNGMATGSARSVPGFNIYQAIKACEGLLTNFGGHDHAAGMSLPVEKVPAFQEQFEQAVARSISEEQLQPELYVSGVLNLKDIDQTFWNILRQFAPFGPGNRSPVFVSKQVVDSGHTRLLKGNHIRLSVRQQDSVPVQGMAFGRADDFPKIKSKAPFHLAYKIEEEIWKGEKTLRLMVKDIWI